MLFEATRPSKNKKAAMLGIRRGSSTIVIFHDLDSTSTYVKKSARMSSSRSSEIHLIGVYRTTLLRSRILDTMLCAFKLVREATQATGKESGNGRTERSNVRRRK